MGSVYKALDNRFEKTPCAVKEMLSLTYDKDQQKYYIERFKIEANILHNLKHGGLPRVKDYFIENGRYYLVMDYIEGKDLKSILESYNGEAIPEDTVIDWAIQILDILEYLHSQSPPIIYRDLKPANIMLKDSDNRLVLIDFGLARTINPDSDSTKTTAGTYAYAPMELFQGKPELRTDLYSLGATMHCLLTGRKPEAPFNFEPVRTLNPSVSEETEKIVMKSLEMEAVNRYKSAKEMKDVLQKLLYDRKEKITVKDKISDVPKVTEKSEKPVKKPGKFKYKFTLIFLVVITVIGIILWFQRNPGEKYYETGKTYLSRYEYENAIKNFDRALTAVPDWPQVLNEKKDALIKLGTTYFNKGNYKEAINCYNAALDINRNDRDALNLKKEALKKYGDEFVKNRNYKEAIACYDEALNVDNSYGDCLKGKKEALKEQGDEFIDSGNYKEGFSCYDKALIIDPSYKDAVKAKKEGIKKIVDGKLQNKTSSEAIKYCREKFNIDIDSSLYFKAIMAYNSGKYDEAVKYFTEALKMDSEDTDLLTGKGIVLLKQKDIKGSIDCFDRVLAIDNDNIKALYYKGLALYYEEKYKESIKYYDEILKINPKYADAWNGKGFLLFTIKKYNEALDCYKKALEIEPDRIITLMNAGNTMYAMQNYEEAITYYKKVLEIEPGNKEAWFNQGNSLYVMKKYRKAIICYDRALKTDHGFIPALKARENALKALR
jgi:tetratricopeptide (TPR) repeat protein/tRNA A-37 threonylcarbamoyl transferase component Bud32